MRRQHLRDPETNQLNHVLLIAFIGMDAKTLKRHFPLASYRRAFFVNQTTVSRAC